jgi:hypothetical protein
MKEVHVATANKKAGVVSALVILVLTVGDYSRVLAASPACQPEITGVKFVQLRATGTGYGEAGELGWLTVGDFFSIQIQVTNYGSTAVSVGSPYQWSFSAGPGHVDLVGQGCLCANLVQLQPGQSTTLAPFCCQAFKATTAGAVTMDVPLGVCTWSLTFEIAGSTTPTTGQLEISDIRIIKLSPSESGFSEVGEVSNVTVGDFFFIYVDIANWGSTPAATSGNCYGYTFSGPGEVDTVTAKAMTCLAGPGQLQPGRSMTMMPFCVGTAFQATTAGWITMNISANGCYQTFPFEIKPGGSSAGCQPVITSIKIVQVHAVASGFIAGAQVSDVNVGDLFTVKVGVMNSGSDPSPEIRAIDGVRISL